MPDSKLKEIKNLASAITQARGFDIYSVQVLTHLNPITIQVQIKRTDSQDVSLEDCTVFSGPISEAIEESQLLNEPYVLEVSSIGLTDQLKTDKEFKTFRGFPVEITYKDESNSELQKSGLLQERSLNHVHLNIKGRISRIKREDVIGVRLVSPTG